MTRGVIKIALLLILVIVAWSDGGTYRVWGRRGGEAEG